MTCNRKRCPPASRNRSSYLWGNQWPPPPGAGNYSGEESAIADLGKIDGYRDPHPFTAPVGSFAPNKLGILDLGGNAYEWCEDFYDGKSGSRVFRGASWFSCEPDSLLSSSRCQYVPVNGYDIFGFRCVVVGGGER